MTVTTDNRPEQTDSPKASREKYWSELDADKKLERMRDIVKRHAKTIQSLEAAVRKLTLEIHSHQHFSDGKAAVSVYEEHSLYTHDFGETSISTDPDKAFF